MAQKKVFKTISKQNRQLIEEFIEVRKSLKKSERTIEGDDYCLSKVANFLGNKNFKDATEKDLQEFFKTIDTYSTYNLLGVKLIKFLNWLFKLKRRERPDNMSWFEQISKNKQKKETDPDALQNQIITQEEYQIILDNCWDKFGMWEGMFETYWLSGGRLNEVLIMRVGDVKIEDDNVSVKLRKSKTIPRWVPLSEYPDRLIRWLQHHPKRDNLEAPLWISVGARNNGNQMTESGVYGCFYRIRNNTKIRNTLSPHCFRKTRATIMFGNPEIGNDDKLMAKFFGWSTKTVAERREEYDGRTHKELMDKIFKNDSKPIETFDIVKQQKERMEQKHEKQIAELEQKIDILMLTLQDKDIEIDYNNGRNE